VRGAELDRKKGSECKRAYLEKGSGKNLIRGKEDDRELIRIPFGEILPPIVQRKCSL